jgi:hypothetical protein
LRGQLNRIHPIIEGLFVILEYRHKVLLSGLHASAGASKLSRNDSPSFDRGQYQPSGQ